MENRLYDCYTPMKRLIEKLPSVAEVCASKHINSIVI